MVAFYTNNLITGPSENQLILISSMFPCLFKTKTFHFSLGLFDPGNYEIHLPGIDLGYVSFSDISPLHLGFTLCFWLKTEYSGFFIEYKVATEQNESLVLGVYCGNNTFEVQLEKKGRYKHNFFESILRYISLRALTLAAVYL